MRVARHAPLLAATALAAATGSAPIAAQPSADELERPAPSAGTDVHEQPDAYAVRVSSETHLRLFRQAFLPGPLGGPVAALWGAPIHEYAGLLLFDLDAPWQPDSIDVELAAWGALQIAELGPERRVDGDLSVALVRHRLGGWNVTLGRQIRAGGAARMTRFDGAAIAYRAPFGLGADAYGGFAVLPRWSAQPGYLLLGSASDSLLRDPAALEQPIREETWLVGGRLSYDAASLLTIAASFHEQRANREIDRRNLGVELRSSPWSWMDASGQVLIDADAWSPSDARAAFDVYPIEELSLSAEYLHSVPALLLSRQSVLSVFSTDAFHEVGGVAHARPLDVLELGAAGYAEIFSADESLGMRLRASGRLLPLGTEELSVHAGYGRVSEPTNGYHSVRAALAARPIEPLELTADSTLYLYDAPVRHAWPGRVPPETTVSWVTSGTGEWSFSEWLATLLGGSLGVTPYAAFDAQLFVRLRIDRAWRQP